MRLAERLNSQFQVFVGVDQTGAVWKSGARPLPIAILKARTLTTHDQAGRALTLASFDRKSLEASFGRAGLEPELASSKQTAIMADCVFGLAEEAWAGEGAKDLWHLFDRAAKHQGYGLKPAAEFFAQLLAEAHAPQTPFPVRECERISGANSVFRTHPFQKNIQCGTYRIWRDLGLAKERWLNIRYFTPRGEARQNKPWVFEAYPSLIWRNHLNLRTRKLADLARALKQSASEIAINKKSLALISQNPDAADAAVLALGGYVLQRKNLLFERSPAKTGREGWIVGLGREPQSPL